MAEGLARLFPRRAVRRRRHRDARRRGAVHLHRAALRPRPQAERRQHPHAPEMSPPGQMHVPNPTSRRRRRCSRRDRRLAAIGDDQPIMRDGETSPATRDGEASPAPIRRRRQRTPAVAGDAVDVGATAIRKRAPLQRHHRREPGTGQRALERSPSSSRSCRASRSISDVAAIWRRISHSSARCRRTGPAPVESLVRACRALHVSRSSIDCGHAVHADCSATPVAAQHDRANPAAAFTVAVQAMSCLTLSPRSALDRACSTNAPPGRRQQSTSNCRPERRHRARRMTMSGLPVRRYRQAMAQRAIGADVNGLAIAANVQVPTLPI